MLSFRFIPAHLPELLCFSIMDLSKNGLMTLKTMLLMLRELLINSKAARPHLLALRRPAKRSRTDESPAEAEVQTERPLSRGQKFTRQRRQGRSKGRLDVQIALKSADNVAVEAAIDLADARTQAGYQGFSASSSTFTAGYVFYALTAALRLTFIL